jgi:hypothetical protein
MHSQAENLNPCHYLLAFQGSTSACSRSGSQADAQPGWESKSSAITLKHFRAVPAVPAAAQEARHMHSQVENLNPVLILEASQGSTSAASQGSTSAYSSTGSSAQAQSVGESARIQFILD